MCRSSTGKSGFPSRYYRFCPRFEELADDSGGAGAADGNVQDAVRARSAFDVQDVTPWVCVSLWALSGLGKPAVGLEDAFASLSIVETIYRSSGYDYSA